MKKRLHFIINPISGGINKNKIPAMIDHYIDDSKFETEISWTKGKNDAAELARKAVAEQTDLVIAVGGDGTINEVAGQVNGTDSIFGLIPLGSGNGLARHLKIPLNIEKALELVNRGKSELIDSATVNHKAFFNIAGIGFDAHVASKFDTAPQRGFFSYAKITLREFQSYKPISYKIDMDGETLETEAFLMCFANGSQFGNNAFVSPKASLKDGLLNVIVIKDCRILNMPFLAYQLFAKKFDRSKHVLNYSARQIKVSRLSDNVVNIDGEPIWMEKDLEIKSQPLTLNVIVP